MRIRQFFLPTLDNVRVRTRGYLPHWEMPDAIYSITYRLHDALPRHVTDMLYEERRQLERVVTRGERKLTAIEQARVRFMCDRTLDRELDRGYGACHLRDARVARLMAENLRHFEGERYSLLAWCLMPNHVHVVMQTIGAQRLDVIVKSWKSYTGREANAILGLSGPFWHREYFDRIVRSEEDLVRTIRYVVDNPVKAGLVEWPWVWSADQRSAVRPASGRRS